MPSKNHLRPGIERPARSPAEPTTGPDPARWLVSVALGGNACATRKIERVDRPGGLAYYGKDRPGGLAYYGKDMPGGLAYHGKDRPGGLAYHGKDRPGGLSYYGAA